MEILQDGATEILGHIEYIKKAKFDEFSARYGVSEKSKIGYDFSIDGDNLLLSISNEGKKICSGKTYLIGQISTIEDSQKKYVFSKNQNLQSVLDITSTDEIISQIIDHKVAINDHSYFISVIMGAYIIAYDFDYVFTIKDNIWGIKETQWEEQIIGEDLDDKILTL